MKPSDFCIFPANSILRQFENEQIALNIMIILKRTGNEFRKITYEEYKKERLKDGNYADEECAYFEKVKKYCVSEKMAKTFSPVWNKEKNHDKMP